MAPNYQRPLFLLFFISGFCGLLYQVIWVRLAFAAFGVITPVLSVVISVFMLGLAIGSYGGGEWVSFLRNKFRRSPIFFYGLTELLIGFGSFTAPWLYKQGANLLLGMGDLNSFSYLLLSAVVITISTLPWCICMGTTFPFMMAFVEENASQKDSFSFLYLANVAGALTGTLVTSFVLIELLGFHGSLLVGAAGNFLVASIATLIGIKSDTNPEAEAIAQTKPEALEESPSETSLPTDRMLFALLLFSTGFISMNMEVIWTRAYTPVLGNEVYSFAGLLFFYLLATFLGSSIYRRNLRNGTTKPIAVSISVVAIYSLIPVIVNDPYAHALYASCLNAINQVMPIEALRTLSLGATVKIASITCTLLSIVPFCLALGYLTPQLIDTWSKGSPVVAGRAYAINIVGSILGPLFAAYVLLPLLGPRQALIVLSLPFLAFLFAQYKSLPRQKLILTVLSLMLLLPLAAFVCTDYYELICRLNNKYEVRRDYAATVIACGTGFKRNLLVNGVGVTALDQCTKTMAHLPLMLLNHKPESALTICFGMGTTHRGLLSWNIDTTAVELVPAVRDSFGYFFNDAKAVLDNPRGKVVIDDGRRYLRRTNQTYDVVTIDPPPPTEAAGLSLLLSNEFYSLIREHLKSGGILQEFIPYGESKLVQAIMRSLTDSFHYVKVFDAPGIGFHCIASDAPIDVPSPEAAVARMPETARKDEMEWISEAHPELNLVSVISELLSRQIPVEKLTTPDPNLKISDDRPLNEYFLLRRSGDALRGTARVLTGKGEANSLQ
jgi:spermidine synthase